MVDHRPFPRAALAFPIALTAVMLAVAGMPVAGSRSPAALTRTADIPVAADHLAVANATTAPVLDGRCDDAGYVDAVHRTIWLAPTFPDRAVAVHIARLPTQVFVCLAGLTTDAGTFAAVYVDPDASRDAAAQSGDTMVSVFQPGAAPVVTTRRGDGAGGYNAFTPASGTVAGASASTGAGRWDAEVRLSVAFLGGDGHRLGLAAAEMWAGGSPGNDKLWPAGALWNAPNTWTSATLDLRARLAAAAATGDAFVRRTYDTGDATNFGGGVTLIAGSRSMGDFYFTWRSLVAVARPALPPGAELVAAALELRQLSGDSPDGGPVDVEACRVTGAWTESTVTWLSQPAVAAPCVHTPLGRAADARAIWDVTSFAADWYGGQPDHGLRVRRTADETSAQHRRDFHSREAGDAALRPRLVVQYLAPATPTSTPTPPAVPSVTPTRTVTPTPPRTPTRTPTPTAEDSPSPTPTATATPTPTDTPMTTGAVVGSVWLERRASSAGATVRLAGQAATTAADGTFRFDAVPAGRHTLRATHPSYLRMAVEVEVAADETVEVLPLVARGGDVDQDGAIGQSDADRMMGAWGARPGTRFWSAALDVTDDGVIDVRDLVAVRYNWGQVAP